MKISKLKAQMNVKILISKCSLRDFLAFNHLDLNLHLDFDIWNYILKSKKSIHKMLVKA